MTPEQHARKLAAQAKYRASHKERIAEYDREYRAANRPRINAYVREHRARKRRAAAEVAAFTPPPWI